MKKTTWIAALLALSSTSAFADYIKNTTSLGADSYRDINLKGYFKLNEKDYFITSFQNTYSSGSNTNEYKLAVGSQINDETSYYISTYFRSEPNNIRALGIDPSITRTYEDLLMEDQSTDFTVGLLFSRYASDVTISGPRASTAEESFYSYGINGQASQTLTDTVTVSAGASYYRYTNPSVNIPALLPGADNRGGRGGKGGKNGAQAPDPNQNRRMNLVNVTDSVLSTSGYPLLSMYLSADWDFLENWSSSYSFSSSKSNYTDLTSYYSSVSVDHTFLKSWNAEAEYTWSNSGFTTAGVGIRYKW